MKKSLEDYIVIWCMAWFFFWFLSAIAIYFDSKDFNEEQEICKMIDCEGKL